LPQFGVLEFVTLRLVDLGVRFGKVNRHEFGKGVFDQHRSRTVLPDECDADGPFDAMDAARINTTRRMGGAFPSL
jgi:hypothetical protein